MKTVAIFCGANTGLNPQFVEDTKVLVEELVKNNWRIVYGGGNIGLMGVVADEVLRLGGEIIGVIPENLVVHEVAHRGVEEMHIVKNMLDRKGLIAQLSDAYIALPGGIGTLDEIYEFWVAQKLGERFKPFGILDTHQFYTPFKQLSEQMIAEGFLKASDYERLNFVEEPLKLVSLLENALQ
ncbi:LOG family protein [Sediminitomix flava]|uniref:Cytokinin riboside 5'-monophosphate phosphoribohydrolase n=1 Tax=Sediminitomix flava TaxID=379075 RepID=A0A315Z804_SEDFL|nr:TIGR00730 family Rossman fold protein [Sediminitomix flava]PWJ40876.1 hypothetical protein BC781_104136 [Sediminitomix flava]